MQRPLPKRTIISNKQKRKFLSKGITNIPEFYLSPTVYFPQERLESGLPNLFMKYENPKSQKTISLH